TTRGAEVSLVLAVALARAGDCQLCEIAAVTVQLDASDGGIQVANEDRAVLRGARGSHGFSLIAVVVTALALFGHGTIAAGEPAVED
ncbi:MAG: hypothetical protein ACOH1K_03670, partial [Rhodoglobus sp.]